MKMKTRALVLATLVTGFLAGTANATAPVTKVRQQVVSYTDLNLENAADAATLLNRIKSAARKVCGLLESGPMPIDLRSRQVCANDAVARALADVDSRSTVVAAVREEN
jgi:UrcA family protein